jgi:VanZ family protein
VRRRRACGSRLASLSEAERDDLVRSRRLRFVAAALALAQMIVIVSFSTQSQVDIPGSWDGRDKLIHAAVWSVLGALFALTALRPTTRAAVVAIIAAAVFGGSDELHQSFVPGRDASLLDLVADTVGATVGAFAVTWYSARRWPAPSSPSEASDPASPRTSSSPITPR